MFDAGYCNFIEVNDKQETIKIMSNGSVQSEIFLLSTARVRVISLRNL